MNGPSMLRRLREFEETITNRYNQTVVTANECKSGGWGDPNPFTRFYEGRAQGQYDIVSEFRAFVDRLAETGYFE